MLNYREQELRHLASYDFQGQNEAEIRGDWIEPLLRLLGYGLGTRHRILREEPWQLRPPVRMIGSKRIEIDFVPTVYGHRLWLIEAKRPQEDLFAPPHLGQAWSYATDPRVRVPLVVLCDGTRFAVFDVTTEKWDEPVFDRPKASIADSFDELFQLLGAPRVAEAVRKRQLRHLYEALEAQVDLAPLDQTAADVARMIDDVRPRILERRREIWQETRDRVTAEMQSAQDRGRMWAHAQALNGPYFFTQLDYEHAVDLVRRLPPAARVREFDDIDGATTPHMWFPLRVLRMATAVLLSEDTGCAEHCTQAAREAAQAHAVGFEDDPLLAAVYRLQRLLGPLGWRIAGNTKDVIDTQARSLVDSIEAEEWLQLDAQFGVTAADSYTRLARLAPRALQLKIHPWNQAAVSTAANTVQTLLDKLPKPVGLEHLQPAGDPWMQSWLTGDPLREINVAVLDELGRRRDITPRVADLVAELRAMF